MTIKQVHKVESKADANRITPVVWVVIILLFAATLRIYGISRLSPPGLNHDEVANWLIDRAILDGNHAVYFAEAYGHEAGFHYLQSLSVVLLGDHALALRLPAVFAGLLLVAVQYALSRRLFDYKIALMSTALLAVLFWPVFYSRLGLRAILLPVISGISLYCWWKAWSMARAGKMAEDIPAVQKISQKPSFWFALAGILAGLTLYTYMASRAVPIFYTAFLLYLFFFHRPLFKRKWGGIVLFILVFAIVAAPLVYFLQSNPSVEFRISEIDTPLREMLAGNLLPVVQNSFKILAMFGISGDPLWRQNVAGRPVFDPLLAITFYAGVVFALWRWRDARYAFLLLWLGAAALPSIVTVDAPSSIRLINILLVVTVFPALIIYIIPRLSTVAPRLSTRLVYAGALLVILFHIGWTVVNILHTWPKNEEVQFVWQAALTDTAAYLDRSTETGPVAVGGWSPATFDPTTMYLSMQRKDLEMRYFGSDSTTAPITTLIIPHSAAGGGQRITRPTIRELAPDLETLLAAWGAELQLNGNFALYEMVRLPQIQPQFPTLSLFGGQVQFLGYDLQDGLQNCIQNECHIVTYWRVINPPSESLRFFLHATDESGTVTAQHDGLDAPSEWWQAGDFLIQVHTLNLKQAMPAELLLGIYEPHKGRRLLLENGEDSVPLLSHQQEEKDVFP